MKREMNWREDGRRGDRGQKRREEKRKEKERRGKKRRGEKRKEKIRKEKESIWDINLVNYDEIKQYDVYIHESIVYEYKELFSEDLDFPIEGKNIFSIPIQKIVMSYVIDKIVPYMITL